MYTWRRALCLALWLCLLVPMKAVASEVLRGYDAQEGYQYVYLGRFPQTAQGEEHPVLWRVLSVKEGQAYLLSEYILFNNRIHSDDEEYAAFSGAFNQTEVFSLLNGPFEQVEITAEEEAYLREQTYYGYAYEAEMSFLEQAFTPVEAAYLVTDEALGSVFLPSAEDLKNAAYGFGSNELRQAYGTPYAIEQCGLFQYMNGSSPYWTRTQSISYDYAARCTKEEGNLGYIRCVVMNEGCRPAVRLRLDHLQILGGSGTMDDPYTLAR